MGINNTRVNSTKDRRIGVSLLVGLSILAVASATNVKLTIGDTILSQRSNWTRNVIVEGLDDCSTTDTLTLEVQLFSDTIFFNGKQAQDLWMGMEEINTGGSAMLLASKDSTSSADPCFINAHITSALAQNSLIIGTFGDGTHWVDVMDELPEELPEADIAYNENEVVIPDSNPPLSDDFGNFIDIMIPYTAEAMCFEAGLTFPCATTAGPILARLDFLVAETNTVFQNSALSLTLQLVHAYMVEDYSEPQEFPSTLDQMQTANDGVFESPSLIDKRTEFCADLVCLIVKDGDSLTTRGRTTFGRVIKIGPTPDAYTAVSSLGSSAIAGFTFAHELGHLLGCRHDIDRDGGAPAFAHGYIDPGRAHSSIMTTRSTCNPVSCTRLPVFSTPLFLFENKIVGSVSGADNRRRIEEAQLSVSNFKDSTASATCPTPAPSTAAPTPPLAPSPTPVPLPPFKYQVVNTYSFPKNLERGPTAAENNGMERSTGIFYTRFIGALHGISYQDVDVELQMTNAFVGANNIVATFEMIVTFKRLSKFPSAAQTEMDIENIRQDIYIKQFVNIVGPPGSIYSTAESVGVSATFINT